MYNNITPPLKARPSHKAPNPSVIQLNAASITSLKLVGAEDVWLFVTGHNHSCTLPLFISRPGTANQRVVTWYVELELNDGGSARRHHRGLHIGKRRRRQRRLVVNAIKNFADNVEAEDQIRTANAEVDANRFTDFGFELIPVSQRAHGAIEHQMLGPLVQQLFQ